MNKFNKKPFNKKPIGLEGHSVGYLKKDAGFTTIYIGNLRYDKDEKGILNIFKKYGYVNFVRITRDRTTHRSKGIAFVQMREKEEALRAIKELNGYQFEGRTLKVSVAIENEKKSKPKPRKFSRNRK